MKRIFLKYPVVAEVPPWLSPLQLVPEEKLHNLEF